MKFLNRIFMVMEIVFFIQTGLWWYSIIRQDEYLQYFVYLYRIYIVCDFFACVILTKFVHRALNTMERHRKDEQALKLKKQQPQFEIYDPRAVPANIGLLEPRH